jgi:hypothetical protein
MVIAILYLFSSGITVVNAQATEEPVMTLTTKKEAGEKITISLEASVDKQAISIDFGDGKPLKYNLSKASKGIEGTVGATRQIKISGHNITHLTCYNHKLSSLDVSSNKTLKKLSCHYNQLSELNVSKNIALEYLNCEFNQLNSLVVGENNQLRLHCRHNMLVFNKLPDVSSVNYIYNYSDQKAYAIDASTAVGVNIDLSSQYNIDGTITSYSWKTESGTELTVNEDYTIANGITAFKKIPAEKVYCEMRNAKFPYLVLKTTLTSISKATAIDAPETKDAVQIYAAGQVMYIKSDYHGQYELYDLSGRQVKAGHFTSGQSTVNIATSGIYIVKVKAEKQFYTQKVSIR